MLNRVTFPSFAPFLFPLGPVFQVHCGTCFQRLYLTPLVFNASPPPTTSRQVFFQVCDCKQCRGNNLSRDLHMMFVISLKLPSS